MLLPSLALLRIFCHFHLVFVFVFYSHVAIEVEGLRDGTENLGNVKPSPQEDLYF